MRGPSQLKKIHEENRVKCTTMRRQLVCCLAGIGLLFYLKRCSMLLFACLAVPDLCLYKLLEILLEPKIESGPGGDLLTGVTSVNSPGMVAFLYDAVVWGLVSKFLFVFSWKGLLFYLGIPLSFGVEFIYRPYTQVTAGRKER